MAAFGSHKRGRKNKFTPLIIARELRRHTEGRISADAACAFEGANPAATSSDGVVAPNPAPRFREPPRFRVLIASLGEFPIAPLMLFASVLRGADDRVAAIRALLVPMRTAPLADARGATPVLTEEKHQLRDSIEFHTPVLQWKANR